MLQGAREYWGAWQPKNAAEDRQSDITQTEILDQYGHALLSVLSFQHLISKFKRHWLQNILNIIDYHGNQV
jgi:hypothetical protein